MKRRNFIKLGAGVLTASIIPASMSGVNFRETKPKAWDIKNDLSEKGASLGGTQDAIKSIFGSNKTTKGKVKLKAPDIAENGAVIPITFSTKLKASKIAIFQSANADALVGVFDMSKNAIANYSLRIKMQQTGTVTVVAEVDGKLYSASKIVKVTIGGCGG